MSKCSLEIIYDKTDRTYFSGDHVRGKVLVNVNRKTKCKGIDCEVLWRTHGRGNRTVKLYSSMVLAEDEVFEAGQTLEYPFQFEIPDTPATYHGSHINIDHYIRVSADIPWALDPEQTEDFIVITDPEKKPPSQRQMTLTSASKSHNKSILEGESSAKKIKPVLFLSVALVVVLSSMSADNIMSIVPGVIIVTLAIVVGVSLFRKGLAEKKFKNIEVILPHNIYQRGEAIDFVLSISPKKQMPINKVMATLCGEERCISSSGTNMTTYTHVFHKQELPIQVKGPLKPGCSTSLKGQLQLPEDAPCSFTSRNNWITWSLQLHVDIPQWPDWIHSEPLMVVP